METKQVRLAHGEHGETAGRHTFNLAALAGAARSVFSSALWSAWSCWEPVFTGGRQSSAFTLSQPNCDFSSHFQKTPPPNPRESWVGGVGCVVSDWRKNTPSISLTQSYNPAWDPIWVPGFQGLGGQTQQETINGRFHVDPNKVHQNIKEAKDFLHLHAIRRLPKQRINTHTQSQ